jgi:hypothetical protein
MKRLLRRAAPRRAAEQRFDRQVNVGENVAPRPFYRLELRPGERPGGIGEPPDAGPQAAARRVRQAALA